MTTQTTRISENPPKPVLVTSAKRVFWSSFSVIAVITLIALVVLIAAFNSGVTTGYEKGLDGTPVFTWGGTWTSLISLFGGLGSFLAILFLAAIFLGCLYGVFAISKEGHHKWIPVLVVIAFIAGIIASAIISPLLKWEEIGAGIVPSLIFFGIVLGVSTIGAFTILFFTSFTPRKRTKTRKEVHSS